MSFLPFTKIIESKEFKGFFFSTPATAVASGIMFLDWPFIHPILVNAISQERHEGFSSTFGTSSRMTWLDYGGQRSL